MTYLLALDQGTSSSRSIVFDEDGRIVALAQQELPQIYPEPGWVEHDPMKIWHSQLATARQALGKAGLQARDIRALGITNQRETTVVWNRTTGQPIHNAIVWQDRRGETTCAQLRAQGKQALIQSRAGLLIDAYFSGTKLKWLLDNVPGARAQAERSELAFGTIDSWLIWQLTGGAVHATDVSNASRTMLFDVHTNQWDAELLHLLDIPVSLMPEVKPSSAHYGDVQPELLGQPILIGGVAGDQQSALFGQACFAIPDHRGFALVGDAPCADVAGLQAGFAQRLPGGSQLAAPDFHRIVLDPTRFGVDLRQLLLRQRHDAALFVKHDAARTGGALVKGKKVDHGVLEEKVGWADSAQRMSISQPQRGAQAGQRVT